MQLKHLAAAAALALGGSAFAATGSLGTLGSTAAGFGDFFPTGATFFSDTFTFTLTGTSNVTGFIGASGITNYAVSVLNSSFTSILDSDPAAGSFAFNGLAAGNYALQVVGFGAAPGAFYGASATAAPVPEPETYALMLAGLGIVGFIAARRRG